MSAPRRDPFELAVEHVAWCLAQGMHPADVFAAIGAPLPANPTWQKATWALALAGEGFPRFTDDERVTIYPPLRKRLAA